MVGDDACGGGAGNEVLMGLELADIIFMFCVCLLLLVVCVMRSRTRGRGMHWRMQK